MQPKPISKQTMHQELNNNKESSINQESLMKLDKREPSIIFKKGIPQPAIQRVLSHPLMQKIINKQLWPLQHGNYDAIGGAQIFAMFEELKIQRIWLFKNNKPNILREIKHIKFDNLTKLMINYNYIVSIEQLYFMNLPSLQGIGLIGNQIMSIKILRKCNFPFLNFVGIQKNFVQDLQYLQQISFDRGYSILLERQIYDLVEGEDIKWVFKLQSKQLQDFWIRSKRRIIKEKIMQKAVKCYATCTFGTKFM